MDIELSWHIQYKIVAAKELWARATTQNCACLTNMSPAPKTALKGPASWHVSIIPGNGSWVREALEPVASASTLISEFEERKVCPAYISAHESIPWQTHKYIHTHVQMHTHIHMHTFTHKHTCTWQSHTHTILADE